MLWCECVVCPCIKKKKFVEGDGILGTLETGKQMYCCFFWFISLHSYAWV